MANCKNGVEQGMNSPSNEEHNQGISSPVDCWELIGSGPSSPLPEAMVDGSALEAAIVAACSSGGSLHNDYFTCPRNSTEHNVLPLSTVMPYNETEAIAKEDEHKEDGRPMRSDSHSHHGDCILHDEDMHLVDSTCHDDNPYFMFLDDAVTSLDYSKTDDANHVMHMCKVMEHVDSLPAGNVSSNYDTAPAYEDSMIDAHTSMMVSEPMPSDSSGHRSSTLADSELSIQNNSMDIHPASTEGDRDFSGQVENALDLRGTLFNTHNIRHCKAFTCASWLWNQFCRWQAQLGYANTIWSVALAAAVMGILVLGRGWQRLQAQNCSLRSQLWAKEKRITQLMFQLMQTKEALAKTRRVPVICVKPALQIPQGQV